jgi:hypothetical protein
MEKHYVSLPSVVMGHLSKTTSGSWVASHDVSVVNRYLNLPLLQSVRFQHLMLFVSLSLVEGCLPKEQRK